MPTKYPNLTHSYLALRRAVGWIGILLPFALMLGVVIIFRGQALQDSISHYYYTGMRDVLVGSLCAIALFMFFYCGYDKHDNWAGNLAGIFALGVAWFPTTEGSPIDTIGMIHFAFAALLFLTLAYFSLVLFTKSGPKPTPRKILRNRIYVVCGVVMLLCLVGIAVYKLFLTHVGFLCRFVYWAETIALVAFGVSWLTKGGTLYPDRATPQP